MQAKMTNAAADKWTKEKNELVAELEATKAKVRSALGNVFDELCV
jgi:hypothetical protein